MEKVMLSFDKVSAHYGKIQALHEVSLHINQGEIVTLIGANGAGKTTLLGTLCGDPRATSGRIVFDDKDITDWQTAKIMREAVAIVPEGRRVFSRMTVEENLAMGGFFAERDQFQERIKWVYELFPRLHERRVQRAGTMSGGEQQMLAIGRALMSNPRLLLLDEPSLGLAPIIIQQIFDTIEQLREQGNLETEGYEVTTATSAEEALETDITSFDLILLDVMMGGMSGFAMAKKLKDNPQTAGVPIIFLTARDTENDTVTGFNLGADDYISKPFSIREVMVRVRAVLRRTAAVDDSAEPQILSYQGIVMNLDKKTVSIDGEEVAFTKTEFELLHLLLDERGRVFSRQELIERIWPKDVLVLDRTVDVNITRLRKKVGRFAKCIVTRLGFGYYFDE